MTPAYLSALLVMIIAVASLGAVVYLTARGINVPDVLVVTLSGSVGALLGSTQLPRTKDDHA